MSYFSDSNLDQRKIHLENENTKKDSSKSYKLDVSCFTINQQKKYLEKYPIIN